MAVLRRYSGLTTYADRRGNLLPRRYKRVSKDRDFFVITLKKPATFDIIALQQYGTPTLFWIIADFNDYLDPTVLLPAGTEIKVPRS